MNWYCVHTKPRREIHTAEQLTTQLGFEVKFPQLKRSRLIRRVRRIVAEPLFPQYLFCRFDLATGYRAVRYAHDVLNVVGTGSVPTMLSEELIEEIELISERAELQCAKQYEFLRGDHVEIAAGPLRGLEAIILDAPTQDDRVDILLSILGCGARLTLDRQELSRA